jgi:type II secretory pathway predicted ATPase ExeA
VWISHWGLSRNPFAESDRVYVPVPGHDEAIAQLVHAVAQSQALAIVAAPAGVGKSTVLGRAVALALTPERRVVASGCPRDGVNIYACLAERLGQRIGRSADRYEAWRALDRALRRHALNGFQVVFAIDECAEDLDAATRRDLESLTGLGVTAGARLTILRAERITSGNDPLFDFDRATVIELKQLTRSEADRYVAAKLESAGRRERIFTPRAITRLHALAMGNARSLGRLASSCLATAAVEGLTEIRTELVDSLGSSERYLCLNLSSKHLC